MARVLSVYLELSEVRPALSWSETRPVLSLEPDGVFSAVARELVPPQADAGQESAQLVLARRL
jgi:hypothetical protein